MNSLDLPNLFDVRRLIEQSMPRPRGRWFLAAAIGAGVFLVFTMIAATQKPEFAGALRLFGVIVFLGFFIAFVVATYSTAQAIRAEHDRIVRIEELVMLRAWPQAAGELWLALSQPMYSHASRVQGLLYLGSVLSRYHRFADAIRVHDYVLEHVELEGPLGVSVRVARAMAMLRDDRLFDADRAIAELRRMTAGESAGVTLVELYRDVKTGHPGEAVELFRSKQSLLGPQLGHRAADAYVLAAKAFAMIGDESASRACYEKATFLAPPAELARRYPEVVDLTEKFAPAPAPPEAA